MKAHCFFEQSGTFKKAFKKFGIEAYDYDILNDFGETDYIVDLFKEIEIAYEGRASVFDTITQEDLIFAFFPCVRFEDRIMLNFRGEAFTQKNWSQVQKLEYSIKLHKELHNLYSLVSKLCLVALRKGLRLIIENPYSTQHYLIKYWSIKPAIIDKDRSKNGDYYKKPTQYFFINLSPKQNVFLEPIEYVEQMTIDNTKKLQEKTGQNRQVVRSLIHPQYAERFIKSYILEGY